MTVKEKSTLPFHDRDHWNHGKPRFLSSTHDSNMILHNLQLIRNNITFICDNTMPMPLTNDKQYRNLCDILYFMRKTDLEIANKEMISIKHLS